MFIISYCLTPYYKKYLEIKGVAFVSREIFKLNIFKRVVQLLLTCRWRGHKES